MCVFEGLWCLGRCYLFILLFYLYLLFIYNFLSHICLTKNSINIFYSALCFNSVTYMIRFFDIFVRKVSLFRS